MNVYPEGIYLFIQPYIYSGDTSSVADMLDSDATYKYNKNSGALTFSQVFNRSIKAKYTYAYGRTVLQTPAQNAAAIKYVPYQVLMHYSGGSPVIGSLTGSWGYNITYSYEVNGTNLTDLLSDNVDTYTIDLVSTHSTGGAGTPIFGEDANESASLSSIESSGGVFYHDLKRIVHNGTTDYGKDSYDFSALADLSASDLEGWVAGDGNASNRHKAEVVWSNILKFDYDKDSKSFSTDVETNYEKYLVECYNATSAKGDDAGELSVSDILSDEKTHFSYYDSDSSTEYFWINQGEYNLHYLDLLICAYAWSYEYNGPTATTTKAWELACLVYAQSASGETEGSLKSLWNKNSSHFNGYSIDKATTFPYSVEIYVGTGTICVGAKSIDDSTQVFVYAADMDYMTSIYSLSDASSTNTSILDKSIDKPYAGTITSYAGSHYTYWGKPTKVDTNVTATGTDPGTAVYIYNANNKHILYADKDNGSVAANSIPKYPDTYKTLSSRLAAAVKARNASYDINNANLKAPFSGGTTGTWWSTTNFCHVYAEYAVISGGTATLHNWNADGNSMTLLRMQETDEVPLYNHLSEMFGGGWLYGYAFDTPAEELPEFVAYLDLTSSLAGGSATAGRGKDPLSVKNVKTVTATGGISALNPTSGSGTEGTYTFNDDVSLTLTIQPTVGKNSDLYDDVQDTSSDAYAAYKKWQEALTDVDSVKINVSFSNTAYSYAGTKEGTGVTTYDGTKISSSFYGDGMGISGVNCLTDDSDKVTLGTKNDSETKIGRYANLSGVTGANLTALMKPSLADGEKYLLAKTGSSTRYKWTQYGYFSGIGSDKYTSVIYNKEDAEFKDSGITVTLPANEESATETVYYQATVAITWKDSNGTSHTVTTTSNTVGVNYTVVREPYKVIEPDPIYDTATTNAENIESYAELKEGTYITDDAGVIQTDSQTFTEAFEAMCGVPSTRTLYLGVGGTEFMVGMRVEYGADDGNEIKGNTERESREDSHALKKRTSRWRMRKKPVDILDSIL